MEHSATALDRRFNPLVGTASWSDKTLLDCGKFYPPMAKTPEARLRFYASQFNLVEVDTVLRHPRCHHRPALGRTHSARLCLQREGLQPVHRAMDQHGRIAQGHQAGAGAWTAAGLQRHGSGVA